MLLPVTLVLTGSLTATDLQVDMKVKEPIWDNTIFICNFNKIMPRQITVYTSQNGSNEIFVKEETKYMELEYFPYNAKSFEKKREIFKKPIDSRTRATFRLDANLACEDTYSGRVYFYDIYYDVDVGWQNYSIKIIYETHNIEFTIEESTWNETSICSRIGIK